MAWSYLSFFVQEARYFGKKYVFTKASREENFPHMWGKFFLTCDGFFHTLSLIKGCEEKKSECLENGYYPVEKTMIIQEIFLFWEKYNILWSNHPSVTNSPHYAPHT